MSATLIATRRAVRILLRDTDARNYAIPSDTVDRTILRYALDVAEDTGLGEAWATVASLTASGSTDFALSLSSQQLSNLRNLRIAATGANIERITDAEMSALLDGASTVPAGAPTYFTVFEGITQGVTGRFYPRPDAAYTVEAFVKFDPSQAVADSTSLPLSDVALRAVELSAAAELLASIPLEISGRLGVSQVVVPIWQQAAERMRNEEKQRRARQKRAAFLQPQVT